MRIWCSEMTQLYWGVFCQNQCGPSTGQPIPSLTGQELRKRGFEGRRRKKEEEGLKSKWLSAGSPFARFLPLTGLFWVLSEGVFPQLLIWQLAPLL